MDDVPTNRNRTNPAIRPAARDRRRALLYGFFASVWLLDEAIDGATFIAAALVILSIAIGRRG